MAGGYDGRESLFSLRELLAIGWVTLTAVVFLNVFLKYVNGQLLGNARGVPEYWPVSIFEFRIGQLRPEWVAPALLAAIAVFALAMVSLRRDGTSIVPVVVGGVVLLVLSNLLHGFTHGFVVPLATREGYYQLAPTITDPLAFIRTYEANQLSYVVHAKTHPPGAVLTFTLLDWLFGSRAPIAAAIALLSLPTSAYLLYRLLGTYYSRRVARYTTLLFVLLPAIQVYYLASIDALITTLMLATVYLFTRESRWMTLSAFVPLLVVSFQLFLFVFLVPVLAGIALFRREKTAPLAAMLLGLVGFYLFVDVALGYNYVRGFLIASNQQNPGGFMLLAEPARYVFTRFEDIAELALFFTPFLCLLAARGLFALWWDVGGKRLRVDSREREPFVMAALALTGFAALLAAGVYHTGETARGAMFMYPFLMLPVAAAIDRIDSAWRGEWLLAAAVFGQALVMQLIGGYLW
ncbi:hypothetical protein [Halococcus sp. AFM35]|uniref:hypothetical protein n=1 Tax=Halococcus sp. AFM35 TaxID=3421653 RepID=UPI003EB6C998